MHENVLQQNFGQAWVRSHGDVNGEPSELCLIHFLPTVAFPLLRFGHVGAYRLLSPFSNVHLHPDTLQNRGNGGLARRASHLGNTSAGDHAERCVLDVSAKADHHNKGYSGDVS